MRRIFSHCAPALRSTWELHCFAQHRSAIALRSAARRNRSVPLLHRRCATTDALTDAASNEEWSAAQTLRKASDLIENDPAVASTLGVALQNQGAAGLQAAVKQLEALEEEIVPPERAVLRTLLIQTAVPFVGFGLMDNAIMITAGDSIDLTLGVMFGFSTMCAAAIGNIFSDLAGVGLGGWIESTAVRMGLPQAELSRAQMNMQSVKVTTYLGQALGITIGCIIGMAPLLWLDTDRADRLKREEKLDSMFREVVTSTRQLLDAERASLFLLDRDTGELWTHTAEGAAGEIRLPWGTGIVGTVAASKRLLNIKDPYSDPRFSRTSDEQSGFKTRSILCAPIFNAMGEVVGVVQALNKIGSEPFDNHDERLLGAACSHMGVAISSAVNVQDTDLEQSIMMCAKQLQRKSTSPDY